MNSTWFFFLWGGGDFVTEDNRELSKLVFQIQAFCLLSIIIFDFSIDLPAAIPSVLLFCKILRAR